MQLDDLKNGLISLFLAVLQKLSALSASLARAISSAEEEEAQVDQFPTDEVSKTRSP